MLKEAKSPFGISGYVEFVLKNKNTGEIIDQSGSNLFLKSGMEAVIEFLTQSGPLTKNREDYVIDTIKMGDDVGTGTFINPEPAKLTDTGSDQNVIYTIEMSNLTVNRPNYYTVDYSISLDGDTLLTPYPNEVDLRITSLSLNTQDGTAIAFRRFPVRTVTREMTIDVKWTLLFQSAENV